MDNQEKDFLGLNTVGASAVARVNNTVSLESDGDPIQRAVSCTQSGSTRSRLPRIRESMTQ